jgi:hypothetical protein
MAYGLYRVEYYAGSKENPANVYVIAAIGRDAETLAQADRIARGVEEKYRVIEHCWAVKDAKVIEAMKPELRRGLPRIIPTELFMQLTAPKQEVTPA